MTNLRKRILLAMAALCAIETRAAVNITALQMISSDENGKIQGVGAHRFKTTNHGGQPCLYVIEGEDLNAPFVNTPCPSKNGVNLRLSVGIHTYTIYAQNANSYSWNNYTLNVHLDNSNAAQISALVPLNSNSPQFFPPSKPNAEFTEDLQGHSVKAPNTLEYKVGPTTVRLVNFRVAAPMVYDKDRIGPFEEKPDRTADYVAQFTIEVEAPPVISSGGVVNAASYSAKLAPGSLFSIFGSDLGARNHNASSVPLPTTLGGTSVTVAGKAAPLVFVSATQINAQVPYDTPMGDALPVIVTVNGKPSPAANVNVMAAAPGVFQFGERRAVVQNADASVNTVDNGAEAGSYVVAYLTGAGDVDNPVATGAPASAAPLSRHRRTVTATVNGAEAEIAFAGLTPEFIGLTQVNLKLPSLAPGTYPLVVVAGGQQSNAAMVTVK